MREKTYQMQKEKGMGEHKLYAEVRHTVLFKLSFRKRIRKGREECS